MLIVRDPRDQFISQMLYTFYGFKIRGNRAGYERARDLLRRKDREPFHRLDDPALRLDRLSRRTSGIREAGEAIREAGALFDEYRPHTIQYEDFVDGRVAGLVHDLGMPVSTAARVDDDYRRVVRMKTHGERRAWLTSEDLELLNSGLAESMWRWTIR